MIYLQIDIKYCTMNKLSMNFQVPLRSHGIQQGLKFAVSRYPRDTEIWFWILSLFYLYPDGIPHFFKNRDSS